MNIVQLHTFVAIGSSSRVPREYVPDKMEEVNWLLAQELIEMDDLGYYLSERGEAMLVKLLDVQLPVRVYVWR